MSRSTGHSDGTLFSRPCVPCVKLLIVLQCRQLFLKGRKDVGTLLWDIFQASRSTGHSDGTLFRVPVSCVTNRLTEFGVKHEGTGVEGGN